MKNLITLVVFRLVVFVSLFCLFLLAFWGIQGYFKSNGNAKLEANSVDAIYNISASGIVAYLYDHYFFPANEITFADEVEFCDDSGYGSIQYQDDNGNWIDADALQLRPIQNAGRIVMTSIPGRVDYTIGMACINSPEDTLSFPCSIQYSFISEAKFKYVLTAPYMVVSLYFQDDDHPNDNDEFFIEFELENCTILHHGEEITGPLRLFVWNKADSGFQGDIWSRTGFIIASVNGGACITDTFSGSAAIEDIPYPDKFFCTFANEIDANLEGNLSFRYGSHSSDYELASERVYLHADDSSLEEDKIAQIEFIRGYLNWDENGAWFSFDAFEPNLTIESVCLNNSRATTFEYNCVVDGISLNGISLFPNMKAFFMDNAMNIEIVGIIIAGISFIVPPPEKLTFGWLASRKKGKYLKE